MSFPGYVKPTQAMVDAGVLYLRNVDASTLVGMGPSRGGLTFNPNKEMRNVEFDGKTTSVAGLDRVLRTNPTISGGLIDFSAKSLGYYEAGNTSGESGGVVRIQPIDSTVFLSEGAYLKDLLYITRNQDNTITVVGFPRALVTQYDVAGEADNEVIANVTIEARLPEDATNLNDPAYRIFKAADLDALDSLLPAFWNMTGYEG